MTHIPFEKVSLQQARAVLDDDPPRKEIDWSQLRQPLGPASNKLTDFTVRWLFRQPPELLPKMLAREYPRIVNRIADLWQQPDACIRYLDELLIDQRGTRSGFPLRIVQELARLRAHLTPPFELSLSSISKGPKKRRV